MKPRGRRIATWSCWLPLLLPFSCVGAAPADQLRPWNEYRVIMWIGDSAYQRPEKLPLFFQRLREMGVNTAMVFDGRDPQPVWDSGMPYYVENMVNRGLCLKWNSKVRDWDKFVTEWAKTRTAEAFHREYSLDDPAWREWARNEMRALVRRHRDHQPLAYDIRDELSVTVSANPFDYDFSPASLAKFREWLRSQYADLSALNRQWETRFASWDEVRPFTTDEIKNRLASGDALPRGQPDWQALVKQRFDPAAARQSPTRWNFAPWCDFRTYMDVALADVLNDLRRTAHELDPHTPVGIEGTQMPHAFGGYDLWRLAQAVDWVEPYDIGNAREIFGSFMPGKPILATFAETETPQARRRLWHLLLEGDRGCIVWWSEDCVDWKSADLALTPKARALAPALKEMTGPLAKLILQAERQYDPVAIHYSQPSIQVSWVLESIVDGRTWHRRFSSYEAQHNRHAALRNRCLQQLQDAGYSPRFISSVEIERGELVRQSWRRLVLPGSLALSDRELERIREFRAQSGCEVYSAGPAGLFDGHGTLRQEEPFGGRLPAEFGESGEVNWPREVRVLTAGARTAVYRYRLGDARLFAFERNITYHMNEDLKQTGGNEALEKPIEIQAQFDRTGYLYDLRARRYLGHTDRASFTLDPWEPSIFALVARKLSEKSCVEELSRK